MVKQAVSLLGAGSWGTALAMVLAENGHQVTLWTHRQNQADEINQSHTNAAYLKEVTLSHDIVATSDLKAAVKGAQVIGFVVPTNAIRGVADQVAAILQAEDAQAAPPLIFHAAKGLELETHERVSVILEDSFKDLAIQGPVVLSGPSHAEEVARRDITGITAACEDLEAAEALQALFMNAYFRVYTNDDVVGVELGGALKNIIALCSGALAGLGFGDNAKAILMTRGLAEITRLGVALGADPFTFAGLSGIGDLIVTCTSPFSRNWQAGYQIGQGKSVQEVLDQMGMIVEGVHTTKSAYELAQSVGIEMPITQTTYQVLYDHKDLRKLVEDLMKRQGKQEVGLDRLALEQSLAKQARLNE
ncbi:MULTISPECIES: NAD(P)H-dependent glycerol-3-phosphate dehydrogenase [Aerococcus]|uniref:NAD(P)H-dependent glycerol-3-phosphate dehydrogenase n=1 Tax=Aerococcus TaxID=1375 RepID=UPI000200EEEE|nr:MULTISPECIES: NAD(P)H-dependent glycerol-3-phosphate dehydrogenase [Aerococcus]AEA00803.1 glycerol-3-phosphate dehydrogenase [NAD(P)+] [Aerococcus sp. Group 1]MCY3030721.1 NAD(P)H-dependent glycerol-3-phosphate dehydrogenase [Aerococcus sp. Group 1]MCY3054352.1 NAD(P)H-dependent glycerol-3-phosphate dehydrogenase [Aerococcus sp. Group 1]MCY3056082.1 NAD(P)H-dependent glycerol-3-phosphate dehydrogenase [Aerococcus sp. Group 1]MCY3062052.1 NAD(P)H-dependent glycerol-3-phosphate dehydrogenase 